MERARRIRRSAEFAAVHRDGRSHSTSSVVLRLLRRESEPTRFGFVVGKRVGGAVIRNRVRRRLREIVRQAPVREGLDIVLIARAPAAQATFADIQATVFSLLRRAGALGGVPANRPADTIRSPQ